MNRETFCRRMAALPEPVTDKKPPFWEYWRHALWQLGQIHNPYSFYGWPPVHHTMLVKHWREYVAIETDVLRNSPDWDKWQAAAAAPDFMYDQAQWDGEPLSWTLLHQCYHLYKWQQVTGHRIENMRKIIEFGGGYGAMALVAHRLGFTGDYAIYDLPEFLLLQQFFLSNAGLHKIKYYDNCAALSRQFGHADLLIACYSLSEVEIGKRNMLLPFMPVNSYLFLYSNRFADYDNCGYFQNYGKMRSDLMWQHERILHLPPESYYSFGWRL